MTKPEPIDSRNNESNHTNKDLTVDDPHAKTHYFKIEIVAASPKIEIWLGDTDGCLVQKAVGKLKTGLISGDYVVEFGLGTPAYQIHLDKDHRTTQAELAAGPTCARPIFRLLHGAAN